MYIETRTTATLSIIRWWISIITKTSVTPMFSSTTLLITLLITFMS